LTSLPWWWSAGRSNRRVAARLELDVVIAEALSRLSIMLATFGGEQGVAIDGLVCERGLARRSENV
jgi:hypothetical protein